ncbi:MAG: hypothetical protein RL077_835 [Verrucomicrobiota bacterium]
MGARRVTPTCPRAARTMRALCSLPDCDRERESNVLKRTPPRPPRLTVPSTGPAVGPTPRLGLRAPSCAAPRLGLRAPSAAAHQNPAMSAAPSRPHQARATPITQPLPLPPDLVIPADYGAVRNLRRQRECRHLVSIGISPSGREIRLAPRAAQAWRQLHAAALRASRTLVPISGFRSIQRQREIIQEKLATGEALSSILKQVAAPGFSEHHTGRALDIGSDHTDDLSANFARTSAFRWLRIHAPRFGFHLSFPRKNPHGIVYEPWHWCWRPHLPTPKKTSAH